MFYYMPEAISAAAQTAVITKSHTQIFWTRPEGPVEIQLSLSLSVSETITNRLHYSHSDFNKTTKQKIGPPADTVMLTSSGITAREPQQNPVLVFSITLTQKLSFVSVRTIKGRSIECVHQFGSSWYFTLNFPA